MGKTTSQPVTVRLLPTELEQLRQALGLSAETSRSDTIRTAISALTGIPLAQLKRPHGRPRKDRDHATT